MRRSINAVLTVVATAGLLSWAAPAGAAVDEPVTGIWWEPEQSDGMIPAPVDIPEGGLWLQSRPEKDVAVSALKFPVPAGQLVSSLVLRVHDERSLPGPGGLRLCAAAEMWFPPSATPGAYAARAVPDCDKASLAATRSPDGTSISFDLSPLGAPEEVDLVLTRSEDAAGLVDIVFEKPLPADVATTGAVGSGSAPATSGFTPASSDSASGSDSGTGFGAGDSSGGSGFASDPGPALDTGSFAAGSGASGEVALPLDAGLPVEGPALAAGEQPVVDGPAAGTARVPVRRAASEQQDSSRTIALIAFGALSLWAASIVSRRPRGGAATPRFTLYSGTPPTA
jgi:hypothetical protein